MAIDTRAKRLSTLNMGSAIFDSIPPPSGDSTTTSFDRQHSLNSYSGTQFLIYVPSEDDGMSIVGMGMGVRM